jgi:O-acetyl-ADP-ribose deacetylase
MKSTSRLVLLPNLGGAAFQRCDPQHLKKAALAAEGQQPQAAITMPDHAARLTFPNGKTLELAGPADITKESTEAIVNAANSTLLGGGGVDGAIHRAGGPSILADCKRLVAKIGHLPAGKAVLTTAGRMPANYVIHTVGPIYRGDQRGGKSQDAETLTSCYRESIRLADDHAIKSLAFPSISTGAYGYPIDQAAEVALRAVIEVLPATTHVQLVRMVLFDIADCRTYVRAAEKISRELTTNSVIFERGDSN